MIVRILCVLMSCIGAAGAAEFHVAPGGDDKAAGSADAPFATIARAQQAVRQTIAGGANKGDILVKLHAGRYELEEPLAFGPGDYDPAGKYAVVYEAADGAAPVISGGRVIDGWAVGDDGVWRTKVDPGWRFNELFVNGERAIRARYPNTGYLRVETVGDDKRTWFTYRKGDLTPVDAVGEMELVFLHDWSISRVRVKSIDGAARRLTTKHNVGPKAAHYRMDHYEKQPRYFLENHASFLDAPGEWHLDASTGVISYKPRKGETPGSATVIAPRLTRLVTVSDRRESKATMFMLRGLTFEHCLYDPGERYAAGQAAFHEEVGGGGGLRVPTPAAIRIDDVKTSVIERCTVQHVGGTGVWVGQRCADVSLFGVTVRDTGGNGIMIGQTDRPDHVSTRVSVSFGLVERVGQRYFGAVGVWIGMANHCQVGSTIVRHTPYTGVSVGWKWDDAPTPCHHHTIEFNHIHHCMQVLSDGGGIYTLGRQPGTTIRANVIHDIPLNAGRAESNGMFLDQGTAELEILSNTIYATDRSSLRFHQARKNRVRSNTFVLPEGTPPVRYNRTPEENIVLEANEVITPGEFDPSSVREDIESIGPSRVGRPGGL